MTAVENEMVEPVTRAHSTAGAGALGGYQPGLDGMRAVGMAAMLAYHAEFAWAGGAFLALSQFFTMSGFLVTTVLLHSLERVGRIELKVFWARRIRRLLPASLAALALIVVFGATAATGQQAEALPQQVTAAAANVANWLFVVRDTSYVDMFTAPSPVQHFWSLSVEEQFYVFLPVALICTVKLTSSRRALGWIVGTGALLSAAWMIVLRVQGASIDRLYYGTDTRLAEMLAGALLAVVLARTRLEQLPRWSRRVAWAGALGYGASLWGFATIPLTWSPMWWGGSLVFSLITCAAIVGILTGTGPLRLLAWGPLAAMGRITYGLYLYHLPIFLWLTAARTGLDQWPLFGLRLAVTFGVAIASYRLLELPIRDGTLFSRSHVRFVLGPVTAVVVVGAAFATVGGGTDDTSDLLRSAGASTAPPSEADDPVLDVLVITDDAGEAVGARLEAVAAEDPSLEVTRGAAFGCDELVDVAEGRTCSNWVQTWPALIQEVDPDAVLLYLDAWPETDLRRLAPEGDVSVVDLATDVLSSGFDLLTVRGAPVIWTSTGASMSAAGLRAGEPLRSAMRELLNTRQDVRVTSGLPHTGDTHAQAYVSEAVGVLRTELQVSRRRSETSVPKVMVVGDSQARLVGSGLERAAAGSGQAAVWNLATPGCGVVNDGTVIDLVTDAEITPPSSCDDATAAWGVNVERFDPDVVIVLSSLRDVQDRRLEGWGDFRTIGDPAMDAFLLDAYERAVDTLSSHGATVMWLRAPCVRYVSPFGGAAPRPRAFEPERIAHLNEVILSDLAAARPDDVRLFALDELLCDDGEFLEDIDEMEDVRPDGIHPSPEASLWLGRVLHDEIMRDLVD